MPASSLLLSLLLSSACSLELRLALGGALVVSGVFTCFFFFGLNSPRSLLPSLLLWVRAILELRLTFGLALVIACGARKCTLEGWDESSLLTMMAG
jgi:hypothetical protein